MADSQITFALGIAHTPWVPARVESMRRLRAALCDYKHDSANSWRVFDEKCPNWKWARDMWEWGARMCSVEPGDEGPPATHFLHLQDDVIPAPNFWPALCAMVAANPDHIIGLQGAHPAFRELARDGHRWARSRAWLVGVGYVIPADALKKLVAWRAAIPQDLAQAMNEDDLIGQFAVKHEIDVHHPIPTLIDHDTEIESTYGNGHHTHRRPTVTWREYGAIEILDPSFWAVKEVPFVTNPHLQACWGCHQEPSIAAFSSGLRLGRSCLAAAVSGVVNPQIRNAPTTPAPGE